MKKNVVFLLVITGIVISNVVFAQREDNRLKLFQKPISEEKVAVFIGGTYGSEKGGFNILFHFTNSRIPGLFAGGEFTNRAQLGILAGCEPIGLFINNLYLTTFIEGQFRLKIIMTDEHPTAETFNGKERILVYVGVGPTLAIKRIRIGAYYNIGQQFVPANTTERQDWLWLGGYSIRASLGF